jgi:hypothetical protein
MDISSGNHILPALLDKAVKLAYPGGSCSTGPYGSIIHVPGQDTARALDIFANWNSLAVNKSKGVLIADGVDSVAISLNTNDAQVNWYLVLDGNIVGEGVEPSVAGVVTLNFSTGIAGNYQVWILRQTGNFASGFVSIVAG